MFKKLSILLFLTFSAFVSILIGGNFIQNTEAASLAVSSYRDFSYSAASVSAPTGQKPQSKLWFNDGIWWGSLFNKSTDNYEIYKLNLATQQWTSTGVIIDSRNTSSADTLWDGSHLYIVSAGTAVSDNTASAKVVRYSYNSVNKTYTQDSGFPVTLSTAGGMETIVIAKDTNNTLWVAYTKNSKVYAAHSTTNDTVWTAPYLINTTGSNNLTSDDIASVIAYGNKVGIMWSNQNDQKIYFAAHTNGTADTQWSLSIALQGASMADDHINMKTDSQGQVYAVTKTSRNDVSTASTEPIIVLSVLNTAGVWHNYTVAQQSEGTVTRGIVSLDESNNLVYVFYTNNTNGGYIKYKTSPLTAISFPTTAGAAFIKNSTDTALNNAATSKQNITPQSGVLVIAGDDTTKYYDHNYLGSSATPTPTATPTGIISPTPTPSAQQIALRSPSVTASNGSGASSITMNIPTNVQQGDVEVSQIVVRGSATTITPPTGWTLIRRDNTASAMAVGLYYKIAGSSEPASYTFNFNSTQQAVAGVTAYSGVSTTNPVDASSGQYNDTVSAMTAPSVTTTKANDRLLWFGAVTVYSSTIAPPSGMTNEYAVNSGSSTGVSADMADQTLTTTGATGNKVGTNSSGKSNISQLVALRPAP